MTGHTQVEIAEVVPLLRLPRNLGVFDYLIPPGLAQLKAGQFVEVTFRRRFVPAVVLRTKQGYQNPRYRYQSIAARINNDFFIPPSQLRLAQWISDYYLQSLATVLRSMTPDFSRQVPSTYVKLKSVFTANLPLLSAEEANLVARMEQSLPITFVSGSLSENFIAHAVSKCFGRNQQALVLVPQLTKSEVLSDRLREYLGEAVVTMPEFTQRQASMHLWQRALAGFPIVVVGTRRAVFAPLLKLGLILVLDEHDGSFKQWDQNPRYHARDVAAVLAEITQAPLMYSSNALSLESFWQAKQKKALVLLPARRLGKIELVNLKTEYAARNFSPLSASLQQALAQIIPRRGLQALLLVNRKGTASFVRCRDCGEIPSCQPCRMPFRYYAEPMNTTSSGAQITIQPELRCHRCGSSAVLPPVCPACGSANFRPVGAGVQRIAALASAAAPGRAVVCFDRDIKGAKRKIFPSLLKTGQVEILVATRAAFGLSAVKNVPLVAVIDPDLALQQPDFRATERTYQMLAVARETASEHFIIQTHLPNHPVYHEFEAHDGGWYGLELDNRQSLGYPPFGRLVRLSCRIKLSQPAEVEAINLANELRNNLRDAAVLAEVFDPRRVTRRTRAGTQEWEIIIKISSPDGMNLPPSPYTKSAQHVRHQLTRVPESWIIDFDPDEI